MWRFASLPFKTFVACVTAEERDALFCPLTNLQVEAASGGEVPPFSDSIIAEADATGAGQSFKVQPRFLLR